MAILMIGVGRHCPARGMEEPVSFGGEIQYLTPVMEIAGSDQAPILRNKGGGMMGCVAATEGNADPGEWVRFFPGNSLIGKGESAGRARGFCG
ncbi:MAG: hypothetical protein WCK77_12040 [Verrucomicrobiota bacterium]